MDFVSVLEVIANGRVYMRTGEVPLALEIRYLVLEVIGSTPNSMGDIYNIHPELRTRGCLSMRGKGAGPP